MQPPPHPSAATGPDMFAGQVTTQVLLPNPPSFAGHQTFALRSAWLKKGLDALRDDARVFSADDALVTLGVGKNMVSAIRHWLIATQLVGAAERSGEFLASGLGTFLFAADGHDQYLEDPATLWLLHWNLCGPGSQAYTWVYAFNMWREWEWSEAALADAILSSAQANSSKTSSFETVRRDVGVFIQTYLAPTDRGQNTEDGLDCPLRELGLLRPALGNQQQYTFAVGPKPSLPTAIFAWALLNFWDWKYPGTTTIAARDIAYTEGSPGIVFKLDEDSTLAYLDQLETLTNGLLRFEDTPLVRQVVRTTAAALTPEVLLYSYYAAPMLEQLHA
ncbi:DUF4007 family protein [Hymenobacter profundi]|uniref:DUF4007 family protein n=1 Tax=Hymenobacter profundi TaxID=1982110 RepID=A0ABS6WW51_9BACT|nr:DUF4007 family protein [Hymenobacter profundi]MBW3127301.1 DUF4007 family protein [Hymenobacter profundi]